MTEGGYRSTLFNRQRPLLSTVLLTLVVFNFYFLTIVLSIVVELLLVANQIGPESL